MTEATKTDDLPQDEKLVAEAECPKCGKNVRLMADAECWEQREDGTWEITGYGPGQGVCCDLLIVDYWEGSFVYELGEPTLSQEGAPE